MGQYPRGVFLDTALIIRLFFGGTTFCLAPSVTPARGGRSIEAYSQKFEGVFWIIDTKFSKNFSIRSDILLIYNDCHMTKFKAQFLQHINHVPHCGHLVVAFGREYLYKER